jgi:hypothetical protein
MIRRMHAHIVQMAVVGLIKYKCLNELGAPVTLLAAFIVQTESEVARDGEIPDISPTIDHACHVTQQV